MAMKDQNVFGERTALTSQEPTPKKPKATKEGLEKVQKRLDEKLIDPSKLTTVQRDSLNRAFAEGNLQGYNNVEEMEIERGIGRQAVGKDIRERLSPLAPRTMFGLGIKRGSLVALGDILGSFTPYIMDGKILAREARLYAATGQGTPFVTRNRSAVKTFKGLSKLLSGMPGFRSIKAFQKTAKVLDGFATSLGASRLTKNIPTRFLRTELKSQALGVMGAAGGSVTYDVINEPAKFAAAAGEDIAAIDRNKYAKFSPLEKITYHAMDNARTALFWNAGAFGMYGVFRKAGLGIRNSLKMNEAQEALAKQKMADSGLPMNAPFVGSGQDGVGGLWRNLNKILGILIPTAGPALKAIRKQVGSAIALGEANLRLATGAPLYHAEIAANGLKASMYKTYENASEVYGNLYKHSEKQFDKVSQTLHEAQRKVNLAQGKGGKTGGGQLPDSTEIPFIPVENLVYTVDKHMADLAARIGPEGAQLAAEFEIRNIASDPIYRYISYLNKRLSGLAERQGYNIVGNSFTTPGIKNYRNGAFLTHREFNDLRIGWNKHYAMTEFKSPQAAALMTDDVLKALEKDLNMVVTNPLGGTLLQSNKKLKSLYDEMSTTLGAKEADTMYKTFLKNHQEAVTGLQQANAQFTSTIGFYNDEANKLVNIMRKHDKYAFTPRQALGISKKTNFTEPELMNKLWEAGFDPTNGSKIRVQELFHALGGHPKMFAANSESVANARYVMGLVMYRRFFDAFNMNAILRKTEKTGAEMEAPFREVGKNLEETITELSTKFPAFNAAVEKEVARAHKLGIPGARVGRGTTIEDVRAYIKTMPPTDLLKFQKRAVDGKMLRTVMDQKNAGKLAIDDLDQKIYITREKLIAEGKAVPGYKAAPYVADVVGVTERARHLKVGGKDVPKEVRLAAQKDLDTIQARFASYQGFDMNRFEKMLGITERGGRAQLIEGFKIARNLTDASASKHVNNIETVIDYLKRNALTPTPDPSSFVMRRMIFALGTTGALAQFTPMGVPGSLLTTALLALGMRAGAKILMSPKYTQMWIDLYSTGQRLDQNLIKTMSPANTANWADLWNYAIPGTADFGANHNPDKPIVRNGDIPDQKIIEYLQDNDIMQEIPRATGMYDMLSSEVKDRYNPERKVIQTLTPEDLEAFEQFNQGLGIAEVRDEIINKAPELAEAGALTPETQQFAENPTAMNIPTGTNVPASGAPSTPNANVYRAMFPGDSLGQAIAERKQKPTLQIPGRPTYNA